MTNQEANELNQLLNTPLSVLEQAAQYLELARQYEADGMATCARIARDKAASLLLHPVLQVQ